MSSTDNTTSSVVKKWDPKFLVFSGIYYEKLKLLLQRAYMLEKQQSSGKRKGSGAARS